MQGSSLLAYDPSAQVAAVDNQTDADAGNYNASFSTTDVSCQSVGNQVNSSLYKNDSTTLVSSYNANNLGNEPLRNQDSFGRWMNYIMADSPGSVDDSVLDSSVSSNHDPSTVNELIFNITEVSPAWAFSTEKTKVGFDFLLHFVSILWFLLLVVFF